MMRDYLFRGKRIVDGEWVYGHLVIYYSDIPYIIVDATQNVIVRYEVDPETVGQWTGLTDKNGTKIFEGDIIYDGDIKVGIISYSNAEGLYHFSDSFGSYIYSLEWIAKYKKKYHVSKSIHDNPEMLK